MSRLSRARRRKCLRRRSCSSPNCYTFCCWRCGASLRQAIDIRVLGQRNCYKKRLLAQSRPLPGARRRLLGREARPTEDRQRDRAEGAEAACERCAYLEGGEIARHRNWHGPAHLKGACGLSAGSPDGHIRKNRGIEALL